jgi:hypothetical protein
MHKFWRQSRKENSHSKVIILKTFSLLFLLSSLLLLFKIVPEFEGINASVKDLINKMICPVTRRLTAEEVL